jgi:HEAT repeat protein
MLDGTSRKLIELLGSAPSDDLRVAAAKVLAEVSSGGPEVRAALSQAMDDPSPNVRLQALAAVGQLRIDQALPTLLERIRAGGPESELAAQAAARLGAKGTHALQNLMGEVAPGLRRRMAGALAAGGTPSASTAAVDALLDSDPGVVQATVSSLMTGLPSLSPTQRRALVDQVLDLLKPKKSRGLSANSEAALFRLLAASRDPRSEDVFWKRLGPDNSAELRIAALQALGATDPPRDRNHIRLLVAAARDPDFRVAAPALLILKRITVASGVADDFLPLLAAPDPAVRRFAIDKVGDRDTPAVSQGLLRQIDHPDRELKQEAITRLAQTKRGRDLLVKALLEASTPDAAWTLARTLSSFAGQFARFFGSLFKQASTYLEADDRRADPLLFLLREVDGKTFRDRLEVRALSFRKKKKYESALLYLRLMARDPACSEEVRFELAATGLRLSDRNLAIDSRHSDPALQQFARLLRSHEVDPADRAKKAKWLLPEDLFYLGFHFAEGDRQEREFGAEILRLAIKRSPRGKLAKDAKSKLRGAGLG